MAASQPPEIRRLGADDAAAYRDIRLEALERHPDAFGAGLDDERNMTPDDVTDRLANSIVFGAFEDGVLVGVAGWYRLSGNKLGHRGALWGMYVQPGARGKGLGAALVRRVLDDASGQVDQLHLTVTAANGAARRLYERAGFASYGVEPRALKIDGDYLDEVMMVRPLD